MNFIGIMTLFKSDWLPTYWFPLSISDNSNELPQQQLMWQFPCHGWWMRQEQQCQCKSADNENWSSSSPPSISQLLAWQWPGTIRNWLTGVRDFQEHRLVISIKLQFLVHWHLMGYLPLTFASSHWMTSFVKFKVSSLNITFPLDINYLRASLWVNKLLIT